MKVTLTPDNPVTDEACKAATGKTLGEWFAAIDAMDGLKIGRREVNNHLYQNLKLDPWWCGTIAVEYEKHHGQRKKDGLFEGYFICSTKTIAAPPAKVYAAFVDAGELAQWYGSGIKGGTKEGDALETADGDKWEMLRVRENKDLRFNFTAPGFGSPSLMDVQFQDKGGKTGLLINSTRLQSRAEADGVRAAWAEALNKLKAHCEA